ncbi:MAG: histidinol-phosphatase [Bacteroidales bacterium]|nr:histidinol-phosphatase [Bacteroidales bacterium]
MILPAYHTHTHYCDGGNPAEDYIVEAIKQKLPSYGYSSHAPIAIESDWHVPGDKFSNYLADIATVKQKYSDKIDIYLGLEIDYIPGIAGRNKHILQSQELDYFIGSIHYVDAFENGEQWNIDTSFELFEKGIKEIFSGDPRKAVTRFYEISCEMIEIDQPDIIGHFDKIKMYNQRGNFFIESDSWYVELVEMLLKVLKKHNTIVEINTRGYYRYGQEDLYPGQWIIEKMKSMDIPIQVNADAHLPEEITSGIEYGIKKIKEGGYDEVWVLNNSKWEAVKV